MQYRLARQQDTEYEDDNEAMQLPEQEERFANTLLDQLRDVKPPLTKRLGDIVHIFTTIKVAEHTFKALLSDYCDTPKVISLQQSLTKLTHDLYAALHTANPADSLETTAFSKDDIQRIFQGLTLCVPVGGPGVFKETNSNCRMLQKITNKLLERALKIGLPEGVAENGEVLDILNWVSRGVKAKLLVCDDIITQVFTRSLVLIEAWSSGDQSAQLISDHNVGKCAVQIQTMYNENLVDLDWKNTEGLGTDNINSLKRCALNFCAPKLLNNLIKSGDTISLLNICNTVKDFITEGLLSSTDTELKPALNVLIKFIGNVSHDALISSHGDCLPLANFSNFMRTLAELQAGKQPLFTDPLPELDATCNKLVTCINSAAFHEAQAGSQALSNLLSFIKLCSKRLPNENSPKTQAALIDAAARLTTLIFNYGPAAYKQPHSMSGLLAGLAYLWERNLIVHSDETIQFMRELVEQNGGIFASAWTDKSRKVVLPHLQMLLKEEVLSLEQMQPALRHILGVTGNVTMAALTANSKRLGAITEVVVPLPVLEKAPTKVTAAPAFATDKPAEKIIPGLTKLRAPEKPLAATIKTSSPSSAATTTLATLQPAAFQAAKKVVKKSRQPSVASQHTEPVISLRPNPRSQLANNQPKELPPKQEKSPPQILTDLKKVSAAPSDKHVPKAKSAQTNQKKPAAVTVVNSKKTPGKTGAPTRHHEMLAALTQGKPKIVTQLMTQSGEWSDEAVRALLQAFFEEVDLIDKDIITAFDLFLESLIEKQGQKVISLLSNYFEKNPSQFSGITEKLSARQIIKKTIPAAELVKNLNPVAKNGGNKKNRTYGSMTKPNFQDRNFNLALDNQRAKIAKAAGWNDLMAAISLGKTDVVSSLLKLTTANYHAKMADIDGQNALMIAISEGHEGIALSLLELDSKNDQAVAKNKRDLNALMFAAAGGHTSVAKALLALESADRQATLISIMDMNALMLAIHMGHGDIASSLLALDSKNEQATALDNDGLNALMIGIDQEHPDLASLLLTLPSADEQARAKNKRDRNALMMAIERGYTEIASLLLTLPSAKEQAKLINKDGLNALMIAESEGNATVITALQALNSSQ